MRSLRTAPRDVDPGVSKGAVLIPNLITVGNAVCGFVALTLIATVQVEGGEVHNFSNLGKAAWFIMLGMVFDVFDGRVARLTGATSDLGAQLDSLADLVTFGLAPAGLVVTLHRVTFLAATPWSKVVWIFGLAYFLGAMLRLARFNVEHDESEEAHQAFKGMPTPGAAGVVATLVIVFFWIRDWRSWELKALADSAPSWTSTVSTYIPMVLPFLCFGLGYAMVSGRLKYPHMGSQLFQKGQSFDFLVFLIFAGILVVFLVEPILCATFLSYMLWPLFSWRRESRGGAQPGDLTAGRSHSSVQLDVDRGEDRPPTTPSSRFRLEDR